MERRCRRSRWSIDIDLWHVLKCTCLTTDTNSSTSYSFFYFSRFPSIVPYSHPNSRYALVLFGEQELAGCSSYILSTTSCVVNCAFTTGIQNKLLEKFLHSFFLLRSSVKWSIFVNTLRRCGHQAHNFVLLSCTDRSLFVPFTSDLRVYTYIQILKSTFFHMKPPLRWSRLLFLLELCPVRAGLLKFFVRGDSSRYKFRFGVAPSYACTIYWRVLAEKIVDAEWAEGVFDFIFLPPSEVRYCQFVSISRRKKTGSQWINKKKARIVSDD